MDHDLKKEIQGAAPNKPSVLVLVDILRHLLSFFSVFILSIRPLPPSASCPTVSSLLCLQAPVAGPVRSRASHLHSFISAHLQMMSGFLPVWLVEQADLFTATSHQHLVGVSFQPRRLINITHTLQCGSDTCVIMKSVHFKFSPIVSAASETFFPFVSNQKRSCWERNYLFISALVGAHHKVEHKATSSSFNTSHLLLTPQEENISCSLWFNCIISRRKLITVQINELLLLMNGFCSVPDHSWSMFTGNVSTM